MAKKRIGTKSKRLTCHKRYKILKKVREHHRKIRKEAKQNGPGRKRKDPGVPNSLPFKNEILKHAKEFQTMSNELRKFNLRNSGKLVDAPTTENVTSSSLKDINKLILEADVILEVLDARDPMGTRSVETEQKILSANKKLVLILNKIDLIPKANLQLWLNYLRQAFVVLPFKANTQKQSNNLSKRKIMWHKELDPGSKSQGSHGQGVDELLSLLANYSRSGEASSKDRLTLTVGVMGYPNTGKSAIINTLKRNKVCPSSNVPGLTKECQRIRLDKNIFLLDSPGIVISSSSDPSDLVLKNCLKPESLPDPLPAADAILSRCSKMQLISKYKLDDYNDVTDFLVQLAHRLGRLKKGGVPNINHAARTLIQDWTTGKIIFFTQPPKWAPDAIDENSSPIDEACADTLQACDDVPMG